MNAIPFRPRVSPWLFTVAGIQAVAGLFLTSGCLCQPDLRLVGTLVAIGMALVVAVYITLGFTASRRPRTAVLLGVITELALLPLMALRAVTAPTTAYWFQLPAMVALGAACLAALRQDRTA